jgi:hypothetical protein
MAPQKEYQAVKDAARHGVDVIFLLVAHPELNPMGQSKKPSSEGTIQL